MKKFLKYFLLTSISLFVLTVVLVAIFADKIESNYPQYNGEGTINADNKTDARINTNISAHEQYIKDSIESINTANRNVSEIEEIAKDKKLIGDGTANDIADRLETYQTNYRIDSILLSKIPKNAKVLKNYRKNLVRVLEQYYPKARQRYVETVREIMYAQNIDVDSYSNYEEIAYTGALFADNKNKLAAKDKINEEGIIKKLRIRTLKFRWYSGDKGGSWSFNVPFDFEIID